MDADAAPLLATGEGASGPAHGQPGRSSAESASNETPHGQPVDGDQRWPTGGGRGPWGPWPTNLPLRHGWMCSVCSAWTWPGPGFDAGSVGRCLGYPGPGAVSEYLVTYPDSNGRMWVLFCDDCGPLEDFNDMEQSNESPEDG